MHTIENPVVEAPYQKTPEFLMIARRGSREPSQLLQSATHCLIKFVTQSRARFSYRTQADQRSLSAPEKMTTSTAACALRGAQKLPRQCPPSLRGRQDAGQSVAQAMPPLAHRLGHFPPTGRGHSTVHRSAAISLPARAIERQAVFRAA